MKIDQEFDVIVIGGGATGAGVARDAAMRKFKTLLIEQGDLGNGTSGRYHGLLHSGGRYVVTDPLAAKECHKENIILKKIAKDAIEDTGGQFVLHADDDPYYSDNFFKACRENNIPIEEISLSKALIQEPLLSPGITRVFGVPDACCDSQKLIQMTAKSAHMHGAQILTFNTVVGFEMKQNRINAVKVVDKKTGVQKLIGCNFVVNAAGIWAEKIANMANLSLPLVPNKGTMVVMKSRLAKRVLNRCRVPNDGDILTHIGEKSIIGTTSSNVKDVNHYLPEAWEEKQLLEEGEKLIKNFSNYGVLSSYSGIRPLFKSDNLDKDSRSITRTHLLINHKTHDNLENMVSIVGGKLTTYRLMAQDVVDEICQNLKQKRLCKTADEELPKMRFKAP